MAGRKFTDTQRETWLDVAQDIGPKAARKELGYPTERTATRWMTDAGVDYEKAPAAVYGQVMRQAYTDLQQAEVMSLVLAKVEQSLVEGVTAVVPGGDATVGDVTVGGLPPTPLDLYRLAGAATRAIDALRLISGRSTANVAHQVDGDVSLSLDDETRRLLEQSRARNAKLAAELEPAN